MKTTDFAKCLSDYLSDYLPARRNVSENTINSYCDTYRLLLVYCRDVAGMKVERISFSDITKDVIESFLDWLSEHRCCSVSTCNQRLAALRSFFRYAQIEYPMNLASFQRILQTPMKKAPIVTVSYLTAETLQVILSQPDMSSCEGRRDMVLLSTLYDTGARVQELVDLSFRDVRLDHPAKVRLTGKGRKTRDVPLMDMTASLLRNYITERRAMNVSTEDTPLFCNRRGNRLTRAGVTYILKKHYDSAKSQISGVPSSVSPHIMRHSKAMHLLQAGINIFYIKDLLGHADISTTEVYAHADIEMKRKALEAISTPPIPNTLPSWSKNENLLSWLDNFKGKRR